MDSVMAARKPRCQQDSAISAPGDRTENDSEDVNEPVLTPEYDVAQPVAAARVRVASHA